MTSSVRLIPKERRKAFTKSLEEAMEEAERGGFYALDQVLAEMDAIIEAAERQDPQRPGWPASGD